MAGGASGSTEGEAPRIVQRTCSENVTCRCGTHVAAGRGHFDVEGLPEPVVDIFRGQSFCSTPCVRASFLENLSVLEGLDTPKAEALVLDLREMYLQLAASFAKILAQP